MKEGASSDKPPIKKEEEQDPRIQLQDLIRDLGNANAEDKEKKMPGVIEAMSSRRSFSDDAIKTLWSIVANELPQDVPKVIAAVQRPFLHHHYGPRIFSENGALYMLAPLDLAASGQVRLNDTKQYPMGFDLEHSKIRFFNENGRDASVSICEVLPKIDDL